MIKFYFDNILINNPINWNEIESVIRNDQEVGGVIITEESNLTFIKDAYAYLYAKANDGFCNTIDLTIRRVTGNIEKTVVESKIFISDVAFNENDNTATVKIQDKSFFAMINNNRSLAVYLSSNKTKNQIDITPATVYNLDVYALSNVIYLNNCKAYRIYEVLKHLIACMTDNRVGFASSLFDVGGEFEGLCITSGVNLRTGVATALPEITWEKTIKELNSILPIAFQIEDPYTNPVLRIEKRSYFKQSGTVISIDNIDEIVRKFERESLYTTLEIGSTITDSDVTLAFPETIPYLGFQTENYNLIGECNISQSLDLKGDWIRSNNIIQRIISPDQSYDENIILFDSILTDATNGRTTNDNFLNLAPPLYYWNARLTNDKIADRYESWVPQSIAINNGVIGDGIFKAFLNSPINVGTGTYLNLSLDTTNVVYNAGAYFDGTDTFTASVSGVYDINVNAEFTNIVITPPGSGNPVWSIGVSLRQFDSTNTLVRTIPISNPSYGNDATDKVIARSVRVVMNQGDYLQLQVGKSEATGTDVTLDISTDTYWECEENTVGGGIFKEYDPDDFPVNLYEFKTVILPDQWEALVANPLGKISFRSTGRWRSAHIKQIKYNQITGFASVSLITDSNAN